MKLVLNIDDNKVPFILELLKRYDFVKISKRTKKEIKFTKEQLEFVDDLKQSLDEVKQHQEGKVKLQSAKEFVNEL